MAEYRMSLTRTDTAPQDIQERCAELAEAAKEALDANGKPMPKCLVSAFDLGSDEKIMRAASKWADGVEPTIISMGKKLGLKPRGGGEGKGDLEYGVHGSDRHPVEFWAQKVFTNG